MKITEEMGARLKQLAFDGVSNAQIAAALGVAVTEVHAYRSQHGLTIAKVAAATGEKAVPLHVDLAFEAALPHTCVDCHNAICPAKGKLAKPVECGAYRSPESRRREYQQLWKRDFLRAMTDRTYGLRADKLKRLRDLLDELMPERGEE